MKHKGLAAFGLATAILILGPVGTVFAQTSPSLINYQGRLMDSAGAPVTGSRAMHFAVLDSGTVGLGSVLWGETQTVSVQVGLYNVLLGSVKPLAPTVFSAPNRWLEVKVAGEALAPRQRLASVPYAMTCDLRSLYANQDADGDGHKSIIFGGDDCNDADPTIHPGAPEVPGSGIDHDCDGYPFGPAAICAKADACGFGVTNCMQDIGNLFSYDQLNSVQQWSLCIEYAALCGDVDTCMMDFQNNMAIEMCNSLSTCGFIGYSACQDGITNQWDGWFDLLLEPEACIQNSHTCDRLELDKCLSVEEFQYNQITQLPAGTKSYSIDAGIHILFGNGADSYQLKTSRGDVYPLTYEAGWGNWMFKYDGNYPDFPSLVSAFPSGPYTLLKGASVKDGFTVPPDYNSDFPQGFTAILPAPGANVTQDPLPLAWQLTGGRAPEQLGIHIANQTRGGSNDKNNIAPDAISSTIGIPAGTQNGDNLYLELISHSPDDMYRQVLNRFFTRNFQTKVGFNYTWTGP